MRRPLRRAFTLVPLLAFFACDTENAPRSVQANNGSESSNASDPCSKPGPGCPCEDEGARIECVDVYSEVGDQVVCGTGETLCEDGVYGECIFNGNVHVLPTSGSLETLGLGNATACTNNPCDPQCMTFEDTPGGAAQPGSGLAEGPDGLTLPGQTGLSESTGCTGGTSGTCAHSICTTGAKLTKGCDATKSGEPSCVTAICDEAPECCTTGWTAACTAMLEPECKVSCYADGDNACFACYADGFDHDGDGFKSDTGDCLECDANVNAGAYDFAGNGQDEDCDGTADNETETCDTSLVLTATDPYQHTRAIDLCQEASVAATGKDRVWGVTFAKLVQADGATAPHSRGYGIQSKFGAAHTPKKGARFASFSSGTARTPGQSGYTDPNGQSGSYDAGTQVSYPSGFPKNATGCPVSGSKAYDSAGLRMKIRVPTNAKSFSYNFNFLSTEYPEWVCTAYNDHFVALLTGSSATPANPSKNSNNISFDQNGNPVSVNIGFFTVPGCATCSHASLTGTGFDGTCTGQTCGGATDWLYTSAPVTGGEEITLHFSVWDQGDHKWDSTLLLDNFRWSVEESTIKTGVQPPASAPTTYSEGVFVRDYDASTMCGHGKSLRWGHWSWEASTPSDSSIVYSVRTASTDAGLDTADELPLLFSSPPGPSALVGTQAKARNGSPNTEHGSAVVDETIVASGETRNLKFLRVTSRLVPSTDKLSAPTLSAWNLQVTCVDDE